MDFSGDYFIERAKELNRPEEFVEELEKYIGKLKEMDLPIILSPQHWALKMGMEYDELAKILESRESHYDQYKIRKKNGGFRPIQSPKPNLFKIQFWLKRFILDKISFPEYLTSYQKRTSVIDNARFHVGKELVIKFDLSHFFEDITQNRVLGLFRRLGYNTAVAVDMAKACCVPISPQDLTRYNVLEFACLPQGSPSSPALSNLAGFKLDMRLAAYAESKNFAYSRYADDLTFSGDLRDKIKKSVVEAIVNEEGFALNPDKTHYIQRSNKQVVTGIVVNEGLSLSKKYRKSIHTHLYYAVKYGPYNQLSKNKIHYSNYREWLLGHILYIRQLHPNEAEVMKKKFELISWI